MTLDLALVPPPPELPAELEAHPDTKPYPTCGRTSRHGEPCKKPAGWGTVHPGAGACKLHGGSTPYGISSALLHAELGDQVEEYLNNPKLLDLRPVIATMRAVADFFLTGDPEREISPSMDKALNALVQVTNAVKAYNDLLYSRRMAVSVEEMREILTDIATIIREELHGYPELQERVARRLAQRIERAPKTVIEQ